MSDDVRAPSGWLRRLGTPAPAAPQQFSDAAQLEAWIAAWMAPKVGIPAASIDPHAPLTDYGLDSMVVVKLSGRLEELLGRPVSPAIAWEYPTIAEVAAHLMEGGGGGGLDMDAV
jgi:polyketide synthase 13